MNFNEFAFILSSIHFYLVLFRCASHNVYVSSANGDLPSTSTSLSKNINGRMNNALMINCQTAGVYQWRVDCVEEESGDVKEGDVWKFTVSP